MSARRAAMFGVLWLDSFDFYYIRVCIDKDTAYSTSPYVALVAQGVVDTHCGIVCFEWERHILYAPIRAGVSRFEAQDNQSSGSEDHSLTVKILV